MTQIRFLEVHGFSFKIIYWRLFFIFGIVSVTANFYQLPDERISISSLGRLCVACACPCCCRALCARYKILIVFKKMSVSQQKLFNYEYKIAIIGIIWACKVFLDCFYPLANEVARGYSNATVRHNPCEHSRINILQWILTKLGTYLVLRRIWKPIDFQGQRSRSQGQIFTA